MKITIDSVERTGPFNLGAGVNDYFFRAFGEGTEGGRKIRATVLISKGAYEGMVKALTEGRPTEAMVRPDNCTALQIILPGTDAKVSRAIDTVRAKSGTPSR